MRFYCVNVAKPEDIYNMYLPVHIYLISIFFQFELEWQLLNVCNIVSSPVSVCHYLNYNLISKIYIDQITIASVSFYFLQQSNKRLLGHSICKGYTGMWLGECLKLALGN